MTTRKDWEKITTARKLLDLGERASLAEIKKAYRRAAKKCHPDMAAHQNPQASAAMRQLTDAYQTLLAYCADYRFPLRPEKNTEIDPEDWWMDRFGDDPLWGKPDNSPAPQVAL